MPISGGGACIPSCGVTGMRVWRGWRRGRAGRRRARTRCRARSRPGSWSSAGCIRGGARAGFCTTCSTARTWPTRSSRLARRSPWSHVRRRRRQLTHQRLERRKCGLHRRTRVLRWPIRGQRQRLSLRRPVDPQLPRNIRPRPAGESEPNPPLRAPIQSVWVASFQGSSTRLSVRDQCHGYR